MSQYAELVKALRYCAESGDFNCNKDCPMYPNYPKCLTKMDMDAAAAIEDLMRVHWQDEALIEASEETIKELQAEVNKWQDVAYQDSLKQEKMQERIWELEALKEAHIKPNYGEWLTVEVNPSDRMHNPIYECTCSRCHKEYTLATIPNYCPNCGAKMEVQE